MRHYEEVGINEGRSSFSEEIMYQKEFYKKYPDFVWIFYNIFYTDLSVYNGVKYLLMKHYENTGKQEGRISNEKEFYEENKLINEILYNDYLKSLQKYNKIKDEFQESAMKSLLIKLSGEELLQIDDNIKNIMDIWKLGNKEPDKILKLKEPREFKITDTIALSKCSYSLYNKEYYKEYNKEYAKKRSKN
jgi:hypothetical protein